MATVELAQNGAPPPLAADQALLAHDVWKHYRLGELQSLRRTAARLFRRPPPGEVHGFEALAGVTFEARRGDAMGIVGTNGSGKSTLLQLLAGTTLPTHGAIRVRGRILSLLAVGQTFHPELTGRENVLLFASSLGIPRKTIEARMEAVGEFAEVESHMDTPVKRYSSGMLSRLSFAIAMQFPADIYVFDEVLAVVDGEFQARCIAEIKRLNGEGRTIIFVSHSLDQVADVCSTALWLERGRVRQYGTTAEVLPAYDAALAHDG
jgi:lipopolysaccharide transport system ATP-binding protein